MRGSPACHADDDDAAIDCDGRNRLAERVLAARLDDNVDAAIAGLGQHDGRPLRTGQVIDGDVGAEFPGDLQLFVAGRGLSAVGVDYEH